MVWFHVQKSLKVRLGKNICFCKYQIKINFDLTVIQILMLIYFDFLAKRMALYKLSNKSVIFANGNIWAQILPKIMLVVRWGPQRGLILLRGFGGMPPPMNLKKKLDAISEAHKCSCFLIVSRRKFIPPLTKLPIFSYPVHMSHIMPLFSVKDSHLCVIFHDGCNVLTLFSFSYYFCKSLRSSIVLFFLEEVA